jgi:hypothetical protein
MRARRHVTALLLLVLFVPTAVLAAMPLKLCLGSDGHKAVELVLLRGHHGIQLQLAEVADDSTVAIEADGSDCADLALLGSFQSAKRAVEID